MKKLIGVILLLCSATAQSGHGFYDGYTFATLCTEGGAHDLKLPTSETRSLHCTGFAAGVMGGIVKEGNTTNKKYCVKYSDIITGDEITLEAAKMILMSLNDALPTLDAIQLIAEERYGCK